MGSVASSKRPLTCFAAVTRRSGTGSTCSTAGQGKAADAATGLMVRRLSIVFANRSSSFLHPGCACAHCVACSPHTWSTNEPWMRPSAACRSPDQPPGQIPIWDPPAGADSGPGQGRGAVPILGSTCARGQQRSVTWRYFRELSSACVRTAGPACASSRAEPCRAARCKSRLRLSAGCRHCLEIYMLVFLSHM